MIFNQNPRAFISVECVIIKMITEPHATTVYTHFLPKNLMEEDFYDLNIKKGNTEMGSRNDGPSSGGRLFKQ